MRTLYFCPVVFSSFFFFSSPIFSRRRLDVYHTSTHCVALVRTYEQLEKKLVKQQYLPHMSLQYGELQPTGGWDRFTSLGHPSEFKWGSRLGSITLVVGVSQTLWWTERHLYLAGRPLRWALAHISSCWLDLAFLWLYCVSVYLC